MAGPLNSDSSFSSENENPQLSYGQGSQSNTSQLSYGGGHAAFGRRSDIRYSRIADDYYYLKEVSEALANSGLESANLIVGIDFTRSNEWTGATSFNGKSLHHTGDTLNPYEQAVSIIGKTLAPFRKDNLIPCFGFGDETTRDRHVFSFYPDERSCNGFEEVLSRYKEIFPHLQLAGPTSFAPIVEMAMTIVEQSGRKYHVLVIIADGEVHGPQEQKTIDAIVKASEFPLSIILVGVGDGPWDWMQEFGDRFPARVFDNFQFVNLTEIMSLNVAASRKVTEFSLAALMKIPSQYKATIGLKMNQAAVKAPKRIPLLPPVYDALYETSVSSPPLYPSTTWDNQACPICLTEAKNMAFGCGHLTCCECGKDLRTCPMCRSPISKRIILFHSTNENQSHDCDLIVFSQLCPTCPNPKDMAFDCGHQTCCECGGLLEQCPVCFMAINSRIKLY
ncbi:Cdk-activating kinase assembly factor [Trema orientale]|uniref:Cdk-activating kinase assembly factor n=1 Tax=Trema orientale TaxID=63057 RepID=A0A2P5ACH5_TREOI|nr:Cdk-activating kinase assembly factor [Trema orientale]